MYCVPACCVLFAVIQHHFSPDVQSAIAVCVCLGCYADSCRNHGDSKQSDFALSLGRMTNLSFVSLSLSARVGLAAPRCTATVSVGGSEDPVGSPWSTIVKCPSDPMSAVSICMYNNTEYTRKALIDTKLTRWFTSHSTDFHQYQKVC